MTAVPQTVFHYTRSGNFGRLIGRHDTVRLAQLGDKPAAIKLVQCFHKGILKLAGKRRGNYLLGVGGSQTRGNELWDERVASAFLAFWEGVCTFKPELHYRLATHCWLRVAGAM